MPQYKVVAIIHILATRTYYVNAETEDIAKRLPFDLLRDEFEEDPVSVSETVEQAVDLVSIKAVQQIS